MASRHRNIKNKIKIKVGKLGKTHPGSFFPIGKYERILETGANSYRLKEDGGRRLLEG